MEYRNLGKTGVKVSPLCLGTMQFGWSVDENGSYRILSHSFEAGLNFIDTADIYSRWVPGNPGGVSEEIIGRWRLQAKIPRDRVVIATKVRGRMGEGPNDEGLSRVHVLNAVEASLRRLQTDYIDLYQLHWPDDETPIEETLHALNEVVKQGKVRYLGVSNFKAWEVMRALWFTDSMSLACIDVVQPHYNLIERAEFERELRAVCATYRLDVIPYSPLAGGFLTGKYRRDQPLPESQRAEGRKALFNERNFITLDKMDDIAKAHRATAAQIALAWLLADTLISSPIIGATSVEQLEQNLGALDLHLEDHELKILTDSTIWEQS